MESKKSYEQSLEELSLMLMYLTRTQDNNEFCRYRELSWKGYDFDTMGRMEEGRSRAQDLLKQYGFSDKPLTERFEFRPILPEEADQAAEIERICFPPNEACSEDIMRERVRTAPDVFLVAAERQTGKLAGFIDGLATDEYSLRDEFYTQPELHNPDGKNVMILGLDVLPEYRGEGLAREMMYQYLRREWDRDRKWIILTCLKSKIKMYEKMGFQNRGISDSAWGKEQWYEMTCVLNI
ncbi:GNAT family N-acetyltransferase [Ruminococcus turbiniformis]|uniref:GNAT family N-acetyltransferase n=1 Tax=Ruminococcus turbiniformis TaxID=2881258 RepID=UPI002A5A8E1B|nr:GNAT family N-acetyltransferase [Ruminococcus turbiniformis]